MPEITAIIPARYSSTRFPGKPLAPLAGKPMIQHVYERTCRAALVSRTIVATDNRQIFDLIQSIGGEAIMTSPDHETGTDRLAEVAKQLYADLIVNVQGDEPLIEPAMIDQAIAPFIGNPDLKMGTLKSRINSVSNLLSPDIVKVVTDCNGFALYFSRSPIPFFRDNQPPQGAENFDFTRHPCYKHVGLYIYRRSFLLEFAAMPQSPLELAEKLEQLRAVEAGIPIFVAETEFESMGVDTPHDLERANERIKQELP